MKDNKNLPNKKQAKNFQFKQYALKTIHIITYILSALFIIVCIVAGVHGCNNKTSSVSAESPSNVNNGLVEYNFNYDNDTSVNIGVDIHRELISSLGLSNDPLTITSLDDLQNKVFLFHSDNNFLVSFEDGSYLQNEFTAINFIVAPRLNTLTNQYFYKLVGVNFDRGDGDWEVILVELNNSPLNYFYDTGMYKTFYAEGLYVEPIRILFSTKLLNNFSFAYQFNFNAPYRLNRSLGFSNLNDGDIWSTYSDFASLHGAFNGQIYSPIPAVNNIYYRIIQVGDFVSNNRLFNNIFYFYINVEGFIFDGSLVAPADSYAYWAMAYYYGDPVQDQYTYFDLTFVNYRNWSANAQNLFGTANYSLLNTTSWTNDEYRFITFFDDLTQLQKDFLVAFNSNEFGNNGFNDTIVYGDNGGVLDVFTLLGDAFSHLSNFLSINILPMISIGTLLFLPLVVGIVMTIFWLIKR